MDPSKRICLKNIPPDCTKREIAEFIRNRTGAQPHSIDLGLDADGRPRRYAHFSAEGARNIVPVLSGATWRDCTITALPARPHYTHRLAEARRRQQQAEQEAEEAREAHWRHCTEKWLAKTGGVLPAGRGPKSFYATRQRYAAVAAEIARKLREEHRSKHYTQNGEAAGKNYHYAQQGREEAGEGGGMALSTTENVEGNEERRPRMGENTKSNQHYKHPRSKGAFSSAKGAKKPRTESTNKNTTTTTNNTTAEKKKEPEKPPAPSKEERKLSGLQAKLAALRAKMK
ncbi:uncharacterized protein TM35_000022490 [Trypanosoma theileri]|uniref:RRM domain-containing protein n=1 Tax=Trypanosoma theileri TaxID=67003 RepID=A0A1X0P8H3_9TRYP|nr:uncharacterized protein TM35_000022490 [Trypanosoma theileri]ORC92923.1 hypothetical protein TM35_000022490 [Trypanosoma theileri]